jgi:hypothetical protein
MLAHRGQQLADPHRRAGATVDRHQRAATPKAANDVSARPLRRFLLLPAQSDAEEYPGRGRLGHGCQHGARGLVVTASSGTPGG